MQTMNAKTDLERYSGRMGTPGPEEASGQSTQSRVDSAKSTVGWLGFPFASVSVLVILVTLFAMSMERGGWSWSSWTYAFSFAIMVPLVVLEVKRKAIITGGAIILLFFMVLIDAGMPGYFGYSQSDLNWYDNLAHYLGTLGMTLFLWSFICWTVSPTGPPKTNGRKKLLLAVMTIVVISVLFEFTEFITDFIFGWSNFHPGIDTTGDIIFDIAGVLTATVVIARHRISALKRPFWHGEPASA